MENKYKMLKMILEYLLKFKYKYIISSILLLLNSISMVIIPILIIKIIDDAITKGNLNYLIKLIFLLLLISIFQNIVSIISNYLYFDIGQNIKSNLKEKLFLKVQSMSGNYYSDIQTGDLMSTFSVDVDVIESFCSNESFKIIHDILTALPIIILLINLDSKLFFLFIGIQIITLNLQKVFSNKIKTGSENIRKSYSDVNIVLQEYISNIFNINIIGANKYFYKRYTKMLNNLKLSELNFKKILNKRLFFLNLIVLLSSLILYGYGGYKVINGTLTLGSLTIFLQNSNKILSPFISVSQFHTQYKQSLISINRILTIINLKSDVIYGEFDNANFIGNIQFKNVNFGYDNDLLKNFNIEFNTGKISGIVGYTGSGKSTIVNLINRLWDVRNGEILIDDINLVNYSKNVLEKNISVISQDVILFNDSIKNNLLILNEDIQDDELIKITKEVGIYDFIIQLPNSFDTTIGDNGIKLSGGQKQKIAIVRALLKKSKIIIFDEATSALDNISQEKINTVIKSNSIDTTIIIIAHRLSTIENADVIYVLKNGSVVEKGENKQLLKKRGYYYELYNS